jgi:hypothetical protein
VDEAQVAPVVALRVLRADLAAQRSDRAGRARGVLVMSDRTTKHCDGCGGAIGERVPYASVAVHRTHYPSSLDACSRECLVEIASTLAIMKQAVRS